MTRDIQHSFVISAPVEAVTAALLEETHIRNWWTREAHVEGRTATLGWSGHGWQVELDMAHDAAAGAVIWRVRRSNMQDTDAWVGTTIRFALTSQGGETRLQFSQTGYRDSPCFEVCEGGWAFFVGTSLKQYLETGRGIPYPDMPDTRQA